VIAAEDEGVELLVVEANAVVAIGEVRQETVVVVRVT
jgi:hypothetical protein